MTEKVDPPGEIPGSARPPSEQQSPQFGLTAAMALTTVGALALAMLFAALYRPTGDGRRRPLEA
jgi:hypothetical protein